MVRGDDGRFVVRLERAERSRDFYIDTPSGRSDTFRLVVHPVPQFEQAGVGYEYPAYTNWPPSAVAIEASGIGAMEGTTATVTIKSNLPLAQSLLELIPAGAAEVKSPATAPASAKIVRVPLKPETHDPTTVQGSFPIRFSGQFRISLMGAEGVPGATTLQGPLACTPDAWPKIQITEPTGLVVAPEDWKVHVAIAASDDVAVRKITISRSVNGWGPATKELAIHPTGPTYATASEDFDLAALGAKGGDVITFFTTAHDNYPSVEHFTDTPVVVIHVITKQEYTDLARTKYRMEQITAEIDAFRAKLDEIDKARAELLAEIEALKKKIAANGGKASEADLRKLDELDAKYGQYAQRSKELAREMIQRSKQPRIYDFEAEYAKMLRDTGDKLLDQADAADKLRDLWADKTVAPSAPRYAGMMADQLQQDGAKTQQADQDVTTAKEDLSKIQQADKMVALVERVGAIAYQQRELAERMAQFRNRETLSPVEQIRARRMAEDQVQIERDLAETLDQMDKQAAESAKVLPKMSASVKELAQNIRDLKVQPDQQDASRLAQAGQGRYAWQACDSAAAKLESLMKESGGAQGMMGEACEDCRLGLMKRNLMQSLQQLAQGRGIPGMGDEGQGKQKGGQGEGYYGSRANMTMLGPHQASGRDSNAAGEGGNVGTGSGVGGNMNKPPSPRETLQPGQTPAHQASGGAASGVPVKYRDLSEAYFRRLADESK
jgi:prefoldin subunit 5